MSLLLDVIGCFGWRNGSGSRGLLNHGRMEKDFDLGVDNEKREILDGIAKYSANP